MAVDPLSQSTLLPAAKPQEPTPAIKKAADEFESMVLSQMLAPMFEALDTKGMFGGGQGEEMFRPMLIEQYAKGIAKAGGIGLSASVAREMMAMQAGESNAPAS